MAPSSSSNRRWRFNLPCIFLAGIAAGVWLTCFSLADEKSSSLPKAFDAKTYPAHETHEDEKFSIAADPYDMPDKGALFRVKYHDYGLLPVRMIFTNDSDLPVMTQGMQIQLITVKHAKLQPSTTDEIFRRISHQYKPPGMSRIPIPLPHRKKERVSKDAQAEVERAQFMAVIVEPHSTVAGFFFFDVEDIANPLAGATIYVNGLRTGSGDRASKGKELFYYEIPMAKYLGYEPPLH